jgi:hypothetical protein
MHSRLISTPDLDRATLLMWGPTAAVTVLFRYDGEVPAVRRFLDGLDGVTAQSIASGPDGTYAFLRQADYQFPDQLVSLVESASVIFLPPVTFLEGGTVTFQAAGAQADLASFYEGLTELGNASIERVHEFDQGPAPATLTDRQRSALQAAVEVGYYDVPRTGDVTDVAAMLDCARSTAGELLRKAEAAVVTDYV